MAKKTQGGSQATSTTAPSSAMAGPVFGLGALLLIAAVVTTAVLSLSYIPGFVPPGCGEDGGCAKLKDHWASHVPVVNWPVAYVGLAYFAAALTVWLRSKKSGLHPAAAWVARLGGLASAAYIVIMLQKGTICEWCLATHIINLVFVGMVEFATPRDRLSKSGSVWKPALTAFALATVAAGGVQATALSKEKAKDDAAIADLVDEIAPAKSPTKQPGANANAPQEQTPPPPSQGETTTTSDGRTITITRPPAAGKHTEAIAQLVDVPYDLETHGPGRQGFTGRYLIGPEIAQVRIVAFSCLQCPDCRAVKKEILELLKARPGEVSFSHKHYPFNSECNPYVSRGIHIDGCKASHIVEAAGMLGGPGAFWEMSSWCFDQFSRLPKLDDGALSTKLAELGIDQAAFDHAMNAAAIDEAISADVEEGHALGLSSTPMVFINGKEFRRWQRYGNLTIAVEEVLKRQPAPMDATGDLPESALAKLLSDWEQNTAMPDLRSPWGYVYGTPEAEAKATVTVYGCYASGRTREVDRFIRAYVDEHPGVAYRFRLYPMSVGCNAGFKGIPGQGACEYARAALAAGRLGGSDGFWKLHAFIMDKEMVEGPGPTALVDELAALAPSRDEAEAMWRSDAVDRALLRETQTDATLSRMRIEGVPRVFVNDKWVMNWRWEGHLVVYDCLDAALEATGQ
ncbi:MAG: thioredoxin domain-containing protein [Phycisphaerales bacterium]|nr:thioredoxin domain-containing protein [Phycisphaerales bacterium]